MATESRCQWWPTACMEHGVEVFLFPQLVTETTFFSRTRVLHILWGFFRHHFLAVVAENKLRYGSATFGINYYYALSAKASVEINQKWIDFFIIVVDWSELIAVFEMEAWMQLDLLIYSLFHMKGYRGIHVPSHSCEIDFPLWNLPIVIEHERQTKKSIECNLKFCKIVKLSNGRHCSLETGDI